MKYLKVLVILLLVFLCGCSGQEVFDTTVPETTETAEVTRLEIVRKRASDVLSEAYKLADLQAVFADTEKLTLEDVHAAFPVVCLKDGYVVYSVEEGGYFYVKWKNGRQDGMVDLSMAQVESSCYVPRLCTERDFDSIVMGVSTADDVRAIDPSVTIDFGQDGFGSGASRGHEYYCYAALPAHEYFFIGFDQADDKLVATEMEIVGEEEACMVWNLDIDEEDWPEYEEETVEYSTYEDFFEQIENPVDGTGMMPLVFVDTAKDARVGYLICAGNNGQVYIADWFQYNGQSLYWELNPEVHSIDYQKGPYSTEILDLNKTITLFHRKTDL